jgi:hypothetical protein
MNAWQRSLEFSKVALKLGWAHKRLLLFPLASAVLTFGLSELLYVRRSFAFSPSGSIYDILYSTISSDTVRPWWPASPAFKQGLDLLAFLLLPSIILFFNTALIHTALSALNGQSASLKDGLSKARAKLPQVLLWAGASGLVLWAVTWGSEGTNAFSASWVGGFIAHAAWNIASYFVIPILIFEGTELRTCLKRSLQLLAGTWKEQAIFRFIFMTVLTLALAVLIASPFLLLQWLGLDADSKPVTALLVSLVFFFLVPVLGVLETVFCAVLYSYAITGMSPAEFDPYPVSAKAARAR